MKNDFFISIKYQVKNNLRHTINLQYKEKIKIFMKINNIKNIMAYS